MKKSLIPLLAALTLGGAITASAAALKVGSAAPEVKVAKWVKGDAVEKLDPAKLYVVEFWATWCPPCRTSIPHLTEMAKKYAGKVQVIGVSVWEREKDSEARLTKVSGFVKDMGAKMDYTVAVDNDQAFMAKEWMEAAGRNGIPSAFIVKDGKIAWVGHPMAGLDEELAKLTGK
jgi:thiol-disulfide isomerase/thioredoxin